MQTPLYFLNLIAHANYYPPTHIYLVMSFVWSEILSNTMYAAKSATKSVTTGIIVNSPVLTFTMSLPARSKLRSNIPSSTSVDVLKIVFIQLI